MSAVDTEAALEIAARILGPGGRRDATTLSVAQSVALAAALQDHAGIADAASTLLDALHRDRAACLFVAPEVTAAHDALAQALVASGYVTISPSEDQTNGQG